MLFECSGDFAGASWAITKEPTGVSGEFFNYICLDESRRFVHFLGSIILYLPSLGKSTASISRTQPPARILKFCHRLWHHWRRSRMRISKLFFGLAHCFRVIRAHILADTKDHPRHPMTCFWHGMLQDKYGAVEPRAQGRMAPFLDPYDSIISLWHTHATHAHHHHPHHHPHHHKCKSHNNHLEESTW